jgi:hypothetical protein
VILDKAVIKGVFKRADFRGAAGQFIMGDTK